MIRPAWPLYGLLALLLVAASCGGSGDNAFENCGNGVVDSGEQCDDGNLVDQDSCLSTCEPNVCGDGFVNDGVEQCEPDVPTGKSCAEFGFVTGSLACNADCTIDTSGCSGTLGSPTPKATPTGAVATPTPGGSPGEATATASPEEPTATPTPGAGGTCQAGDTVVVTTAFDQAFAAFAITLAYPTDAVNVPGSGQDAAVKQRVQFVVSGGLSTSSDDDDIGGDGVDDTLHASFVSNVDNPAGPIVTVTFDCTPGQPKPAAGAFTCTVVSASNSQADTIDPACSVSVQ